MTREKLLSIIVLMFFVSFAFPSNNLAQTKGFPQGPSPWNIPTKAGNSCKSPMGTYGVWYYTNKSDPTYRYFVSTPNINLGVVEANKQNQREQSAVESAVKKCYEVKSIDKLSKTALLTYKNQSGRGATISWVYEMRFHVRK